MEAFAAVPFLMVVAVLLVVHFLPTIIAYRRGRQVASVFVINLLLGWTLIGWAAAFAIALSDKPVAAAQAAMSDAAHRRACPHCAEPIQPLATVCRFCGRDTGFGAVAVPAPGVVSLQVARDGPPNRRR